MTGWRIPNDRSNYFEVNGSKNAATHLPRVFWPLWIVAGRIFQRGEKRRRVERPAALAALRQHGADGRVGEDDSEP